MSRKRSHSAEEEQQRWLEEQRRRRDEATARAEAQRKPVPGYRRLQLEDEY